MAARAAYRTFMTGTPHGISSTLSHLPQQSKQKYSAQEFNYVEVRSCVEIAFHR